MTRRPVALNHLQYLLVYHEPLNLGLVTLYFENLTNLFMEYDRETSSIKSPSVFLAKSTKKVNPPLNFTPSLIEYSDQPVDALSTDQGFILGLCVLG